MDDPIRLAERPRPPVGMDPHERLRLRAAALRVQKVYPGAAGRLLSREIMVWHEFGYRLGDHSDVRELINEVMTAKLGDGAE